MHNINVKSLYDKIIFNEDPKYYFDTASVGIFNSTSDKYTKDWNIAVDNVKKEYMELLIGGVDSSSIEANMIHIFHNTTAAIQRVFQILNKRIFHSRTNLLTTDAEYPGIIAAAYENWAGDIHIAKIDELIWQNRTKEVIETLKKAFLLTKPQVFFVSHVFRATGYSFPLMQMVNFIKNVKPDTVIIVDGAQAVGNITISKDVLDNVDFYITSGHKWLCGKTTLGLAYAKMGWDLKDPAQSYSLKLCSGGTGDFDVLYSSYDSLKNLNKFLNYPLRLIDVIEGNNRDLSNIFIEELKVIEGIDILKFPQESDRNGIVVFTTNKHLDSDFFRYSDGSNNYHYEITHLTSTMFLKFPYN